MADAPGVTVFLGDCLDVLGEMPDGSVDAIVTDPPYGLGFMGKEWDDLPPGLPWARECLRVLKPGAFLLAFGGTRTWHRLAVAVDDAGFEMRDSIAWLHGQGFPKSKNQLKPAFEPIVVARKPLVGTVAANVLAWGTGALNIDAARVNPGTPVRDGGGGARSGQSGGIMGEAVPGNYSEPHTAGRWPTNVVLDDHAAAELDKGNTVTTSQGGSRGTGAAGYAGGELRAQPDVKPGFGDTGGPSRFFPVFKYQAKAPTRERPSYVRNDGTKVAHTTVKPLDLMRWLVRLATPPGGTVLEPFAGSGTTVEACLLEGFGCIAIERDPDSIPLIVQRTTRAQATLAAGAPPLFDDEGVA